MQRRLLAEPELTFKKEPAPDNSRASVNSTLTNSRAKRAATKTCILQQCFYPDPQASSPTYLQHHHCVSRCTKPVTRQSQNPPVPEANSPTTLQHHHCVSSFRCSVRPKPVTHQRIKFRSPGHPGHN
ncbi:unnamed protein product [Merluccius merluccius]